MKKSITQTIEIDICDNCGKESDLGQSCRSCGYHACWTCRRGRLVEYSTRTFGSTSLDSSYCLPCDIELCETKADPIHQAYVALQELRGEWQRMEENFSMRQQAAEATMDGLLGRVQGK